MDLNPLIEPRSLIHQQQSPVCAPIERKHLAFLHCGDLRITGFDDFI